MNFWYIVERINPTPPGGSLYCNIFAELAEFQRDIVRENTVIGIEAARKRGKRIGSTCKLNEYDAMSAHEMPYKTALRRAR